MLSLAAGGPVWHRPIATEIAVMVDLSPSTRTAHYRNRAQLQPRISQLLGRRAYRIYYFAQENLSTVSDNPRLPDLPADHTVFAPPAAAAVLLFSDARFALPASAPPTFAVVDPGLETPDDASVTSLEVVSNQALAAIRNSGEPRQISFSGVDGEASAIAASGNYRLVRNIKPDATRITARLAPQDAWPENDQLTSFAPPPKKFERWWVGQGPAMARWRTMTPAALPADPTAFLEPGLIVLSNVAASQLSDLQQRRLAQYVTDLGGTLVILGGDRAFAAGAYSGTTLEAVSPLASTPPQPTSDWIILVDSSGSMASAEGGASRWQYVTDAANKLIPRLPADDLLSVGSFAQDLKWWTSRTSVRQATSIPLPPRDVFPHGPTNLDFALRELSRMSNGTTPTRVILLTDADAQIDDPPALAEALKQKKISLYLLALGNGSGLPALRLIAQTTGGSLIQQSDPRQWIAAAQDLLRAASPDLLVSTPIDVRFAGPLAALPPRRASLWNRTWLKSSATAVAEAKDGGQQVTVGGIWNRGQGRVAGLAFPLDAAALEPVTPALQRPPRDPRFHVRWETGPKLTVTIDALDAGHYVNGANLRLQLSRDLEDISSAALLPIPQTAPGQYQIALDAPRAPAFASVLLNQQLIDRIAVAGRYAPEFDAIGNDRTAMQQLAQRTGGRVVLPTQTYAVDFPRPRRAVSLTPLLAILGAAFIALALVRWRIG